MAGIPRPDRSRVARQVRQHLDSLKDAGVDYLPFGNLQVTRAPAGVAVEPLAPSPSPCQASPEPANLPPKDDLTPDQRRHELKVLADKVAGCTRCAELVANRRQTVFGVGPTDVELCFVGEAPGQEEDRRGEPFVGDAGQLLNKIIAACGMKREEVYICNILKCRPPKNRAPLPNEAANCREYLDRQLDLVRPKFICCLGASAVQNLLGTTESIGRLRGSFQEYRGIPVMCTFHPAYLLRSPDKKKDVWEDMKKLLQRMGRPLPTRGANGS